MKIGCTCTFLRQVKVEVMNNGLIKEGVGLMFTNSTDAYQSALKIMGHDYANKYANYWSKKNKTIKSGKANFKDSGRQKTYNAEFDTYSCRVKSCIQKEKNSND